jgi:transcriptional regulator with XRE-family HTH domain
MNFREHLKQQLETDPEFRREWEAQEPQRRIIQTFVETRSRLGWTQAELAARMQTTQANISRAETTGRVSAEFFERFLHAVGGSATVTVKMPKSQPCHIDLAAFASKRAASGTPPTNGEPADADRQPPRVGAVRSRPPKQGQPLTK